MDTTSQNGTNASQGMNPHAKLLNQITSVLPSMVYQVRLLPDKTLVFPYVSNKIQEFFELSPQDVVLNPSHFIEKIHPDDIDHLISTAKLSAKHFSLWTGEFRVVLNGGKVVWLYGNAKPELESDGGILWTGFLRDITELKLLREKLSMSLLSMQSDGETASDFLFEMTDDGVVQIAYSAFSELMPSSEDVFIGKNIKHILPGLAVEAIYAAIKEVDIKNGRHAEYYSVASSHGKVWFEVSVAKKQNKPPVYAVLIRDITRNKQTQDNLLVSSVAFDALSEAVMISDANRIIVSVNQAFVKLTGYSSEEIVGKKARFYSTINAPEVIAEIRRTFQDYTPFAGEVLSYKKDGTTFCNELSITPVFDKQLKPTHFVGVIRDITERKALQSAVEESRNLLLTIIDAAPVRIYWKDIESRYLGCNLAFANDVGLQSPSDIFGKDDFDLVPAEFAEKYRLDDLKVMASGVAKLFYEEQSINSSGQVAWALKSKVPLKNAQGETIGLLGVFDNITDRKLEQEKLKKTKQALLESSERYLDLYEFAPVGYLSIDNNGMVAEANWKARSLLGMKRKDLSKERFSRYIATQHKKEWQTIFTTIKSFNHGGELEFDIQITQADGDTLDTKLSCIRVDDASNIMIRVTIADITHAKHAEKLLRQQESYQRSLLDNFPFMVWLKDDKSRLLTANNQYLKNAGYTSHLDVVGKSDLEIWPVDLAKMYIRDDQEVIHARKSKTVDEIIEVDGKHVWYETYKSPVIVNDKVIGTVGFARDITNRRRAVSYEQFRGRILELLVREHSIAVILEHIAKGIEQLNPMMFCIIALLNPDKKTLHVVSAPSLPDFFVQALEGMKIGLGMGSIGTVAYTKQRLIVEDVMAHPYWQKNKELALKAGIGSSWAEPIIGAKGDVLGTFGVYHHQAQSPTDYDITLIEQSARLISIAIERSETSSQVDYLAYYDEVTSLPNRRFLLEQLKRAMSINLQTKAHVAVLYLDLDQFKAINESRGHDVGDLLLVEVSNRLKRCVQAVDVVARIGGDEFVVMLENLSEQLIEAAKQAEVVADKILKVLSKPYTLAKHKHHSSVSIGITLIGKEKTDVEDVLKQSDIAMYQAKKSGRNTFCFFDHKMQANITTLVALENELRNAIKNNQLHLYYQVQVDHLGQPFGAEALIRWIHPERGMVSPAQFIPLAEESGLIIPIGHWVLDTACAQIKAWQDNPSTRDLTLSVNISAKQFRQSNFVEQVQSCVERHAIDPMFLRLELTESMLLENVEETVEYMNALGKIGVQFSLDDFGTGYSSLQYLKRLPLYQLKIDQSFVRDIVIDSHDRTIVRTIIAMAQSMYIGVIAEGVETAEQQELLLTNGCRRYQGYLFGKPVPIEMFNQRFE